MKGKFFLAATITVSLAAAFLIGKSTATPGAESKANAATSPRPDRPTATKARDRPSDDNALLTAILGGRPISEIPTADLAVLIASLSKYEQDTDPLLSAKHSYQFQLLLAKLSPAALSAIADNIASDPEANKNGSINSLLAAIARKDPDRALDWLSTGEVTVGSHSAVLSAIAEDDPLRAAALLRHYLVELDSSGNNLWIARNNVARAMAKLGAEPILGYLDSLPVHQQGNSVFNILESVPADERFKLLEGIRQRMTDGSIRRVSFDHLFANTLSYDAAAATEWLSKLPDGVEKTSLRHVATLSLLERGEMEAAGQWLRETLATSPGREKDVFGNILLYTANDNPDGAAYLARFLPGGVEYTASELEHAARCSFYSGTGGLTSIASIIRDPAEQARLIAIALEKGYPDGNTSEKFKPDDYEILSRRIAAMGFTGENATLVNESLETAKANAAAGGK